LKKAIEPGFIEAVNRPRLKANRVESIEVYFIGSFILRPAGKPESDEDEDTKVIISHPSMNRNEGENRQRRRTAI
jgi:hypothetical protein